MMLHAEHPLVLRIREAYDRLTPGQHRIVRLLLESPHEVAFLSAAELGRRAEVSDSTVVRLPAVLGYAGYPELRQELQATLTARMAPAELLRQRLKDEPESMSALTVEIDNLERTRRSMTPELLASAVEAITSARTIHVIGQRSGFGLAYSCVHLLRQVLPNVRLLTFLGGSVPDELADMGARDTLIAFSTTRYSRQILQVARHARAAGCHVIAVTDSAVAPIAMESAVTLVVAVASTSFFPSNVAATAVIQLLTSEIARRHRRSAARRLTEVDRIADEFNVLLIGSGAEDL